jgi:hypothetical protein
MGWMRCRHQPGDDYEPDFLLSLKKALVENEEQYVQQVVDLMTRYQKPVIGVSLLTDEKDRTIYMADNAEHKGVFYNTPERAVKTLSKMFAYYKFSCLNQGPENQENNA